MKTLHIYLTRQVVATLLMTVAVFTFVLLLGNVLREILELLINRQASLGGVLYAIGLLIPFVLVFALPMGMLTAALLVFGRFSADQELTAVKSSGISLISLVTPILVLSLALCGLSAWINLQVGPHSRVVFKEWIQHLGAKVITSRLPEGRYSRFTNGTVYVGKVEGDVLSDLTISYVDNEGKEVFVSASRGWVEGAENVLHLEDVRGVDYTKEMGWGIIQKPDTTVLLGNKFLKNAAEETAITDMTFRELRAKLREIERPYTLPIKDLTPDELVKLKQQLEAQKSDMTMPLRVQMHRQVAFSFACFGFTLVGIPLGIRAHRRETNIGIAMALALVFVYYSFIVLGQSLQGHTAWAPYLIMWIPNFLFQAVGAVMLWRANRGI